jgi:hypothetical protein
MSTSTLVTVTHGVVSLAITAAATVLLSLHDIDGTTALALYGAAIALVGGTTSTLLALRVPANVTPPEDTPKVTP